MTKKLNKMTIDEIQSEMAAMRSVTKAVGKDPAKGSQQGSLRYQHAQQELRNRDYRKSRLAAR